jgi:hypothetical protein
MQSGKKRPVTVDTKVESHRSVFIAQRSIKAVNFAAVTNLSNVAPQ